LAHAALRLPKNIMFVIIETVFPSSGQAGRNVLMTFTDRDIHGARNTEEEELLTFEVSDEALERTATIIGGQATPVTLVYGTSIVGNCACPV
jgi:hypothetical protein